ncbi:phosphate uptake regulator PhoU [Candidatus Woesearchaeota archaeon]|nr:phosphate uptake regulator PhoU [Candidatus Woesearchaeota archaeon]
MSYNGFIEHHDPIFAFKEHPIEICLKLKNIYTKYIYTHILLCIFGRVIYIKRKVVLHGPSTLIISLPSKWAKKYNIEKGAELEVLEEDKNLIITSDSVWKPLEVDIDISNLDRSSIMYVIRSLYRLGYDVVRVQFQNSTALYQRTGKEISVISIIHTEINRLIGYEIIQEKGNSCIIKDIQETSTKDFDQILRRIFLMIIDTFGALLEGAKVNSMQLLETIEGKHDTITKFVSYCMRMLNKKGYPTPRKTAYYYHIIAYLDRVTDILKYAARDLISYNKKLNPQAIPLLELVNANIRLYYDLFYKYENKKIVDMDNNRYKAEKIVKALPSSLKPTEMVIVVSIYHIMEMLLDLIEARTALQF